MEKKKKNPKTSCDEIKPERKRRGRRVEGGGGRRARKKSQLGVWWLLGSSVLTLPPATLFPILGFHETHLCPRNSFPPCTKASSGWFLVFTTLVSFGAAFLPTFPFLDNYLHSAVRISPKAIGHVLEECDFRTIHMTRDQISQHNLVPWPLLQVREWPISPWDHWDVRSSLVRSLGSFQNDPSLMPWILTKRHEHQGANGNHFMTMKKWHHGRLQGKMEKWGKMPHLGRHHWAVKLNHV